MIANPTLYGQLRAVENRYAGKFNVSANWTPELIEANRLLARAMGYSDIIAPIDHFRGNVQRVGTAMEMLGSELPELW